MPLRSDQSGNKYIKGGEGSGGGVLLIVYSPYLTLTAVSIIWLIN